MWHHPGREKVLQDNAGKDATLMFEKQFHSQYARNKAKRFVIGKVIGKDLGNLHHDVTRKLKNTKIDGLINGLSGMMTIFVGILSIVILRIFIMIYRQ